MRCHPIASTHTMRADLLTKTVTQGRSGQPVYDYAKDREISCLARGILGQGIRVVGSAETFIAEDYEDVEVVKMRTTEKGVTKAMRITNIRDPKTDTTLWENEDGPIVFNVEGITPVFDPFNTIIEYDILLRGVTGD